LAIKTNNQKEHLVNEDIAASGIPYSKQVRVISEGGEQLGMMTLSSALDEAATQGLDLVMISANSDPQVCRIMDYGKFRFEREKKKKEAKKNQQKTDIKEIQLSCRIDVGDFNTKANRARKFLEDGDKVKTIVMFKGRQMAHQDVGHDLLDRFASLLSDVGTVDKKPLMEGRTLTMFISPIKQAQPKQ